MQKFVLLRPVGRFVNVWIGIIGNALFGHADIIQLKNGQVLHGVIVSESTETVILSDRIETKNAICREVSRAELAWNLRTLSLDKLETLHPKHPERYRHLAEDLSRFPDDPIARDLAVRLWILSFAYGSPHDREDALLMMISQASDVEKQWLVEFQNLQHNKKTIDKSPRPQDLSETDIQMLKELIQATRREDWKALEAFLQDVAIVELLNREHCQLARIDFQQVLERKEIQETMLLRLLRWEHDLDTGRLFMGWQGNPLPPAILARSVAARPLLPAPIPQEHKLAERFQIDLEKSVYRGGEWQVPRNNQQALMPAGSQGSER